MPLEADLAAILRRADNELDVLRDLVAAVSAERDQALNQLDDAHKRIAELEAGQQPDPDPEPTTLTRIGMSAPANLWDQRLAEVGPEGVTARRIFCTEMSIRGRLDEIRDALAADMLPVLSFKGTPTAANVAALRAELQQLNADVTATWHHEPRGDMTGPEFCAGSKTFLGVKSERVQVGPILNGFLLDTARGRDEWATFSTPELLDAWSFLGVDTYQPSIDSPKYPARTVKPLVDWLEASGHPDLPVYVCEYNGFTAEAIRASGEAFLAAPQVKVAICWNSTGKPGSQEHIPLAGDRLEAFQATKQDPRAHR